jgi:hypothetical protein
VVFVELQSNKCAWLLYYQRQLRDYCFAFPLQGGMFKSGWLWEREEGTDRQLILLDLFRYSAMIKNSSFQAFWHIELTDYGV